VNALAPGAASEAEGDPEVDAVLAPLGSAAFSVGRALAAAPRNGDPVPEGVPAALHPLVAATQRALYGAESARLNRAAAFGARHLGLLVTALFCASLPHLFLGAKGVLVLRATGRVESEIDARINETGRFVLDVWAPDAARPEGRALRSAVQVRLLHGAVRAHLRGQPGFAAVPINQLEMLATLLAFSVVALDGVERLGVTIDPRDAEDVWHLWRTVGVELGITPANLPDGLREARRRMAEIEPGQAARSPGGDALARVLLRRIEDHFVLTPGLPRRLWTWMLGDRRLRMLGLEPGTPLRAWEVTALRTLGGAVGPALLDLGVQMKLGGRTPTYSATSLRG
jgi:hypothetical protein